MIHQVKNIFWKKKAVGIKLNTITPTDFSFEVLDAGKDGKRYCPYVYTIKDKEELLKKGYDIELSQRYKTKLVYIPVDDLVDYADQAKTAIQAFNH